MPDDNTQREKTHTKCHCQYWVWRFIPKKSESNLRAEHDQKIYVCINQLRAWASAGQQQSLICDVSERVCVFCVICIGCSTWIGIFRIDRQWPFLLAYWLVSPRKHGKSELRKKRWILFIDFAVTCGHVVLTLTHGWAHTSCTLQKPFHSIRFDSVVILNGYFLLLLSLVPKKMYTVDQCQWHMILFSLLFRYA